MLDRSDDETEASDDSNDNSLLSERERGHRFNRLRRGNCCTRRGWRRRGTHSTVRTILQLQDGVGEPSANTSIF